MERKLIEVHMRHGEQANDSMTKKGIHEFLAMVHILWIRAVAVGIREFFVYRSEAGRAGDMEKLLKSAFKNDFVLHISRPTRHLNPVAGLSDISTKMPACPAYGNGLIPVWREADFEDLPEGTETWGQVQQRAVRMLWIDIFNERDGLLLPTDGNPAVLLYHGGVIEPVMKLRFGFDLTDLPSATMILVYETSTSDQERKSYSYELLSPYGNQDWAARKEEGEHEID